MARPFHELRCMMRAHDITNVLLARELGVGVTTVSHKLNAHYPWTAEEMWKIMDLFNQPAHRLHQIFPRNGKNTIEPQRILRRA